MASNQVVEVVQEHLTAFIEKLGYEVVDIEYDRKGEEMHLTVFIFIESGVTLDDCEKVHRAIDPILDELNPTQDKPYILNVSSPGLDRPFKTLRDFERNYGKEVEVKLYAPLKGKKRLEGILKERTENTVTVVCGKEELKLENNKMALIRPLVKFE